MIGARRVVTLAVLASLALASMTGCAVHFAEGPLFDQIDVSRMPVDPAQLLSISHAGYDPPGEPQGVAVSLVAAERVMVTQPNNRLAHFYAARASLWLLEFSDEIDEDQAKALAEQGYEHALKAVESDGGRGDYAFLCGALLGYKVKLASIPNPVTQKKVRDYFVHAVQISPYYDDGAPLRALGTLLVMAPAWPAGVGDVDEGIEYLEKAARLYPGHPASHLFLANAYEADGRREDAIRQYQETLATCEDSAWGIVCDRYGGQAAAKLARLGTKTEPASHPDD